uniref:Retroviral polymerase SH3-like domain-containing protein n=1 Tax=Physcomitrium patens TaxID=3218 RepID=A0A2K1ITF3_PHYPA|nr:hypothetical protein PHYPA_024499 [Physcomitrium patens]
MIERQTRKFIKGLRTNNREEFILQDFLNYSTKTKIYLSNRLLTRINNLNMSLKEMFSMNKPKLCHLKTFGCLSHVHIGHQSRNKLQSRSITCNFVGYDKQTKGYCIH